ncbi:hypothetical protein [Oceanobacillus sp. FSL K6-0251]|uniref:hypothetical protein n=1 Tax=Oceanobacillus sp. FSL K6-0251 TaxID=2921602 RepID=UPI0030F65AB0
MNKTLISRFFSHTPIFGVWLYLFLFLWNSAVEIAVPQELGYGIKASETEKKYNHQFDDYTFYDAVFKSDIF